MKPPNPIEWTKITDHSGKVISVHLSSCEIDPYHLEYDVENDLFTVGRCDVEYATILIDAAESTASQDEVLLHEMIHYALSDFSQLGVAQEEEIVEHLSPRLLAMLVSLGFRTPSRPYGSGALKVHARNAWERLRMAACKRKGIER